jgi:hypothetical protein
MATTTGQQPASRTASANGTVARAGWQDPRYDIALRDFGLMVGALSLGRLAAVYDAR